MKRFIDMEQSLLSMFLLYRLDLCCTANEYYDKDFFNFISRVIIVQDFETITFLCVICIEADLLCYFLLNEKAASSIVFSSCTFPQSNLNKKFLVL